MPIHSNLMKAAVLALALSAAAAKDISIKSDASLQDLATEINDSGVLEGYKKIEIGDGVTSLEPLKDLVQVKKGSLIIEDTTALVDLTGLESLAHVDEELAIEDNEALTKIDLPGLESVGMTLTVEGNDALETVTIENVSSIGMGLEIEDNKALEDLTLDISSVGKCMCHRPPV